MTEKFSGGFVVVEKVIIESVNVGFKPIYVRQDGLSGLSGYVVGRGRGARQYDCWSRLVIYLYIRLFSVGKNIPPLFIHSTFKIFEGL